MSGGVRGGNTAIKGKANGLKHRKPESCSRSSPKRAVKPRKHLTEEEVERLMKAARETGRYGERDAALILLAYRHGLRVAELVALTWHQVDSRLPCSTSRGARTEPVNSASHRARTSGVAGAPEGR